MVVQKFAKKVYKKVVKPYVSKKKGYTNRMKLYKEVAAIKKMVNAEKKTKDYAINVAGTAQLANGADGIICASIIPTITQGVGYDNREGRSIRCSGLYLRGQLVAQTNTVNKVKYNLLIVKAVGKPQTPSEIVTGMFNQDFISNVRDYFAPRNPDSFRDYRIIASRDFIMQPDSITGQKGITDFMLPLKVTHHIRYSLNTNTIEEGDLFYILRADSGDSGTPLTGSFFSMSIRFTYYDN